MHNEMGTFVTKPNPENCKNCSSECAYAVGLGMGVLDFDGNRRRGRGSFGDEFGASHCNQWGLCDALFSNYFEDLLKQIIASYTGYISLFTVSPHFIRMTSFQLTSFHLN